MPAKSSNDVTFEIYSKSVKSGEKVILGTNGQSAYCVNYTIFASDAAIDSVKGDVNADGKFDIIDIVMLKKYLLGAGEITDSNAGDLCRSSAINVFDLCIMKNALLNKSASRRLQF